MVSVLRTRKHFQESVHWYSLKVIVYMSLSLSSLRCRTWRSSGTENCCQRCTPPRQSVSSTSKATASYARLGCVPCRLVTVSYSPCSRASFVSCANHRTLFIRSTWECPSALNARPASTPCTTLIQLYQAHVPCLPVCLLCHCMYGFL